MANSIRAQIKHLFIKKKITRNEYDWFMKKAYGHDEKLKAYVASICAEEVAKLSNTICGTNCPIDCEWEDCQHKWKEYFLQKVAEKPFR